VHGGFSIKYPRSWQADETPQGNHGDLEVISVISRIGRSFPTAAIARRQFVGDDINQVAEWGETRVKEHNPYAIYKFIAKKPLNTDNYDGLSREYYLEETTLIGQVIRHCQDWYLIEKKIGYSLSFCVDDKDWPQAERIFQEMIQSFTISGN